MAKWRKRQLCNWDYKHEHMKFQTSYPKFNKMQSNQSIASKMHSQTLIKCKGIPGAYDKSSSEVI